MADHSQFIKNPLIVALDVDSRDRALALVDELAEIAMAHVNLHRPTKLL